jgi:hypothetical protein
MPAAPALKAITQSSRYKLQDETAICACRHGLRAERLACLRSGSPAPQGTTIAIHRSRAGMPRAARAAARAVMCSCRLLLTRSRIAHLT